MKEFVLNSKIVIEGKDKNEIVDKIESIINDLNGRQGIDEILYKILLNTFVEEV